MTTLKLAHVRQQGVDLIIIPLDNTFAHKMQSEKADITDALQAKANAAGLRGTVVPVWSDGGGMGFLAPVNWHSFFRSIDLSWVWRNVNRQISY